MKYKGYEASFDYDEEQSLLKGVVINNQDIITFYGTIETIKKEFEKSIDEYIEFRAQMKKIPISELILCIDHMKKSGGCQFGAGKICDQCGTPYLLWKMISGELLCGEELKATNWEQKLAYQQFIGN